MKISGLFTDIDFGDLRAPMWYQSTRVKDDENKISLIEENKILKEAIAGMAIELHKSKKTSHKRFKHIKLLKQKIKDLEQ